MSIKPTTTGATGPSSSEQGYDIYLMRREDIQLNAGFLLGFLDDKKGGLLDLYEPEEFIQECLYNQNLYLWIAVDRGKIEGLLPVCFESFPRGLVLHIVGINCEDFRKYRDLIWKVEKWAFDCGCGEIQYDGAPAMARLWGDEEYREISRRYSKPLVKKWGH
jgi:hypothetical protein